MKTILSARGLAVLAWLSTFGTIWMLLTKQLMPDAISIISLIFFFVIALFASTQVK